MAATAAPTATPSPSPTPTPSPSPTPAPTATPTPAATQAPAAGEQRATDIQGIAFEATIEVAAGSRVIWTNQDGVMHTVTARDNSSDSGTFSQGATYSLTFSSSGTFNYFCTVHPFMQGTVVVGDGRGTASPSSRPPAAARPPPAPPRTTGTGTSAAAMPYLAAGG
ncbi:MAG: plastocyanin/azurin family copper-binding protein [Dehalococcoidia bacterium]|nr:plastocyanin/azurin family copper-binding protein [Dehalococcoidia bacterium]